MNVGSVTPSRTTNCGAISGHRYYNPSTGRWLSKDPIEERGGLNLYGFVENNPLSRVDRLGLADFVLLEDKEFPVQRWTGLRGLAGPLIKEVNVWMTPFTRSCCHKIHGKGRLQLGYWAMPGSEDHEKRHLQYFKNGFNEIKSTIEGYEGKCYSMEKAACLVNALEKYVAAVWQRVDLENRQMDWAEYGKDLEEPLRTLFKQLMDNSDQTFQLLSIRAAAGFEKCDSIK
ncbi:MAG: RHS repeat-associated core domain-containing protein [Verrucomicrobiales bacterium]